MTFPPRDVMNAHQYQILRLAVGDNATWALVQLLGCEKIAPFDSESGEKALAALALCDLAELYIENGRPVRVKGPTPEDARVSNNLTWAIRELVGEALGRPIDADRINFPVDTKD